MDIEVNNPANRTGAHSRTDAQGAGHAPAGPDAHRLAGEPSADGDDLLAAGFGGIGPAGVGSLLLLGLLLGLAWLAFRSGDAVPSAALQAASPISSALVMPVPGAAPVAPPAFVADGPSSDAEDAGTCRLDPAESPLDASRDAGRPAPWAVTPGLQAAAANLQETTRVRSLYQASLAGSSDALTRAAGLVLGSAGSSASGQPTCPSDHPACREGIGAGNAAVLAALADTDNDASRLAAIHAWSEAHGPDSDALARLALAGSSPQVYAVAWQACVSTRRAKQPAGACQMLSAEQWARLDPDNAAPWLEVARLAQERGDASTEAEAMFRVGKARTVDVHRAGLANAVLKRVPPEVNAIGAVQVATELLDFESGTSLSGLAAAMRHCRAEQLADANRHQLCSDVAETLLLRSHTLMEHTVGLHIMTRLGWSEARVEAVRAERDAMQQALARRVPVGSGAMTCKVARQWADLMQAVARQGELDLARQSLRDAGKPPSELGRGRANLGAAQAQAQAQAVVELPRRHPIDGLAAVALQH